MEIASRGLRLSVVDGEVMKGMWPGKPGREWPCLKLSASGGLAGQEEGFRVGPLTADLEGAKVLIPKLSGGFGFSLTPELQLIEVLGCDLALAEPIEQVIAKRRRQVGPLDLRHLFPERDASQFILDAPQFSRIGRIGQAVSQLEEPALFHFFRFQSGFDQFHQDSISAGSLMVGQSPHAFGKSGWERNALSHSLICSSHCRIIHQSAPHRT